MSKAQKKRKQGIKVLEQKVDVYTKKAQYFKKQLEAAQERVRHVENKKYVGKYYYSKTHWPRIYKVLCISHGNLFGTTINIAPIGKNRFAITNMHYIPADDIGNEISEIVFNRELDKWVKTIKTQTKRTYGYR